MGWASRRGLTAALLLHLLFLAAALGKRTTFCSVSFLDLGLVVSPCFSPRRHYMATPSHIYVLQVRAWRRAGGAALAAERWGSTPGTRPLRRRRGGGSWWARGRRRRRAGAGAGGATRAGQCTWPSSPASASRSSTTRRPGAASAATGSSCPDLTVHDDVCTYMYALMLPAPLHSQGLQEALPLPRLRLRFTRRELALALRIDRAHARQPEGAS